MRHHVFHDYNFRAVSTSPEALIEHLNADHPEIATDTNVWTALARAHDEQHERRKGEQA